MLKKNQVSKLKGLVEELDIKSNEAIRLNNLNPWTSIWLSGWSDYRERARERERGRGLATMFWAQWQDWELTGEPHPSTPPSLPPPPSPTLVSDYGNEERSPRKIILHLIQ